MSINNVTAAQNYALQTQPAKTGNSTLNAIATSLDAASDMTQLMNAILQNVLKSAASAQQGLNTPATTGSTQSNSLGALGGLLTTLTQLLQSIAPLLSALGGGGAQANPMASGLAGQLPGAHSTFGAQTGVGTGARPALPLSPIGVGPATPSLGNAGSVIGGVVGTAVGGPAGGAIGAAIGGAAGTAAGVAIDVHNGPINTRIGTQVLPTNTQVLPAQTFVPTGVPLNPVGVGPATGSLGNAGAVVGNAVGNAVGGQTGAVVGAAVGQVAGTVAGAVIDANNPALLNPMGVGPQVPVSVNTNPTLGGLTRQDATAWAIANGGGNQLSQAEVKQGMNLFSIFNTGRAQF